MKSEVPASVFEVPQMSHASPSAIKPAPRSWSPEREDCTPKMSPLQAAHRQIREDGFSFLSEILPEVSGALSTPPRNRKCPSWAPRSSPQDVAQNASHPRLNSPQAWPITRPRSPL